MNKVNTVLLVDDEALVRQSTAQWLKIAGYEIVECASASQALMQLSNTFQGILVTDVKMPGMDGLQLMKEALSIIPDLPVILITGHGDIDMATQALKNGAYDFMEKPFVPERLVESVFRACEKRRLTLENQHLINNLAKHSGIDQKLIGFSTSIQNLKQEITKIADLPTNVIIYGETGTGKELVAQCLHEFSGRNKKPFVPINCGAIPESLIESELFGHEAGAFTGAQKRRIGKFEYASGGTLFLDEIEAMPTHLQIKLLRALQEGVIERLGGNESVPVDLRVIAASKVDLLADEQFREDLFYRLNVSQVYIPPLRDRLDDVPLLFEHYVRHSAVSHEREARKLCEQDMRVLAGYNWPGNVRELKNAAIRFALDEQSQLHDILYPANPMQPVQTKVEPQQPLATQVAAFEASVIKESLILHNGNIKAVMEALDLPRRTLNQKMVRYGLNRADYQK